jgi:hypothetical protein
MDTPANEIEAAELGSIRQEYNAAASTQRCARNAAVADTSIVESAMFFWFVILGAGSGAPGAIWSQSDIKNNWNVQNLHTTIINCTQSLECLAPL